LRTSVVPPVVSPDEEVEDPAGLDRKRVVNIKSVGHRPGVVFGDVAWVPQDDGVVPGGKVDVITRNSPVHLSL
jgi:IMP dehydrogenase/GMP reductase